MAPGVDQGLEHLLSFGREITSIYSWLSSACGNVVVQQLGQVRKLVWAFTPKAKGPYTVTSSTSIQAE